MLYTIKEIFKKIESDIKEYGHVTANFDFKSFQFEKMYFNLDVQYNKRFSNDITIIIRNNNNILHNWTIDIKDLNWIKEKIEVL